jgi:excisionase family DNA binding protein
MLIEWRQDQIAARRFGVGEEFVTMSEAQEMLGVSNFTIWRMVKDGRLTAYPSQIDRRKKLIRRSDIEALRFPDMSDGDAKKVTRLAA